MDHFSGLLHRRDLLRVGSLSLAASALPLATARAASSFPAKATSVICLWMGGGVTHIDSFDPKPDAPEEIRGTLNPIATSLPGVQFTEVMPHLAAVADQLAVVRSFSHDSDDHLLSQVYTLSGRKVDRNGLFREPNIGSIVSQIQGPRNGLPGYIAVPGITRPGPPPHNLFVAGWLGSQYKPYCLGGLPAPADFTVEPERWDNPDSHADEDLRPRSLVLSSEVPLERLDRRAGLRNSFDRALQKLESLDRIAESEGQYQNALRLLAAPSVRDAFDLSQESQTVKEHYGQTKIGGRCLMARRLVEAGARFVLVDYGYDLDYGNLWDNHAVPVQRQPHICEIAKRGYHLAGTDQACAALVRDLSERGLLDSTLVVFLHEFGRTPRINKNGGRDHWGRAGSIFFAGGGTRAGQVIGATDAHGSEPVTSSYTPADVAATIYQALGIDPHRTVNDILGRPRPLLDHGRPISAVLS